jgi:hypothetical protein
MRSARKPDLGHHAGMIGGPAADLAPVFGLLSDNLRVDDLEVRANQHESIRRSNSDVEFDKSGA